jgi:RNA polymerase sigma factor (sigma-70 family)
VSRWEPLLEQLVTERYPGLVARGVLLTGSRVAAEDLVQDALVSTFSGRARFASLAEAEAYVRRAMTSRSVDAARRAIAERRAMSVLGAMPAPTSAAEHGLDPTVVGALGTLSPRVRACVVLRHLDDQSVRDTARLLNLSEGAVKRYVSDGVTALNAILGTVATGREDVVRISGLEVRHGA